MELIFLKLYMKKFIVAFDGLKFSESTRDYAIDLAKQSSAHLVGVFLEDLSYHSYTAYDLIKENEGIFGSRKKKLNEKDVKIKAAAVKNFEMTCKATRLQYSIHRDRSIAIQELLHESIYADLLIIDFNETFSYHSERTPTQFIRDLLSGVQCPVLAVPHEFKPVDKLVLLYDGEPSSVHAIKMFSYTVASLKQNPVKVLSVKNVKQSLRIPDNKLMTEFIKRHFPRATFTVLKGFAETEIVNYLKQLDNGTLVVLGAYQRGIVSRWFRASMADVLMQNLMLPMFIAHNK
jgi:nucleotide-binding universal stress UspA family protein